MRASTVNAQHLAADRASSPLDVQLMNVSARLLFVIAVLAFALWAVAGLMRLPGFSLGGLDLDGDTARYTPAVIRSSIVPKMRGNFFTVDLAQAQASFESLPWVRHAIVRRIWPNRLLVTLQEHHAAAIWHREDEDDQLVNTAGEVFDANADDIDDARLPTFNGPADSASQMLQMHAQLSEVLAPLNAHIDTLRLSERGSWSVVLDTGAELELGRGSDEAVIGRTRNFMATIDQVLHQYGRPLEYADLRYPKGYALRLHGVSTVNTITAPQH